MDEQSFQDEAPHAQDSELDSEKPRPISEKKLEANRRNAQKSTGPVSEEGKKISSMNALKHGLLARDMVVTRGPYKEDEMELLELLESEWERWNPVGRAEELEVEKIAHCYWRTMRAVRYETSTIEKRAAGVRDRHEGRLQRHFEDALQYGHVMRLEGSARGLAHIIDALEQVKQELAAGRQPVELLTWLVGIYPDDFTPDPAPAVTEGTAPVAHVTPQYVRQAMAAIEKQLGRLRPLRKEVAQAEKAQFELQIGPLALLDWKSLERTGRHETRNERHLDRHIERLEGMQQRRRASVRTLNLGSR